VSISYEILVQDTAVAFQALTEYANRARLRDITDMTVSVELTGSANTTVQDIKINSGNIAELHIIDVRELLAIVHACRNVQNLTGTSYIPHIILSSGLSIDFRCLGSCKYNWAGVGPGRGSAGRDLRCGMGSIQRHAAQGLLRTGNSRNILTSEKQVCSYD